MADDFGGFDDAADGDVDDFGFDDDFGEALEAAEAESEPQDTEDKIQTAKTGMKSLPRTNSFANKNDTDSGTDAAATDDGVDNEEDVEAVPQKTSVGGGVAGAKQSITGSKTGWLKMMTASGKMTLGRKAWKERWFILARSKLVIQAGPTNEKLQRTIDLSHALGFERDDGEDGDPSRFSLITKQKEFFFTARNAAECESWVENLKKAKEMGAGTFTKAHTSGVSALMF
eukprot:m.159838 g.159838  ORF g.159838 m.159838 type:complete len:229 (-) comp11864_c0_seq1:150-836(-)